MDIIESLKEYVDLIVRNDLYLKCWSPRRDILLPIIKINKGFIWQKHVVCDGPSPPPGPFVCETITETVSIGGWEGEISELHISKTPFQSPRTYVIQVATPSHNDRFSLSHAMSYDGVAVETTEDAYNEQQSQLEQCAKLSFSEVRNLWFERGNDSQFTPNVVAYLYRAHLVMLRKWDVIEQLKKTVEFNADILQGTSVVEASEQYFSVMTYESFFQTFIKRTKTNRLSRPQPEELERFQQLETLFWDLDQALPRSESMKELSSNFFDLFRAESRALLDQG
jgi:hypothetical protein